MVVEDGPQGSLLCGLLRTRHDFGSRTPQDFCSGVPPLLFPMQAHWQDRVKHGLLD